MTLMFYETFINDDYFELPDDTKEFSQRVLFLEYFEEWERLEFKRATTHTFRGFFIADMYMHLHSERYETVQLYQDTLDRYEKDWASYE